MKLIERVLLGLAGLLAITVITVFFIAPEPLINILNSLRNVNIVLRLAVVLVLDILILAFVYSRLRTPSIKTEGLVVKAPGAITDIGIDSARARILSAVQQVPNVIAADVKLEAVRGKAKIDLNVTVRDSNVNVPRKHQEINQALKQVINKQLGLSMLGQPRVHIHLDDERVVPVAKPKEEPAVVLPKISNGVPAITSVAPTSVTPPTSVPSVTIGTPVDFKKDEGDIWLENYTAEKSDEEKKNGDAVKP